VQKPDGVEVALQTHMQGDQNIPVVKKDLKDRIEMILIKAMQTGEIKDNVVISAAVWNHLEAMPKDLAGGRIKDNISKAPAGAVARVIKTGNKATKITDITAKAKHSLAKVAENEVGDKVKKTQATNVEDRGLLTI
jgi:hypothetical protein